MPKRKVKYTKRNPQPTPPAEKPKQKAKPKKVKAEKPNSVSTAVIKLADSKQGRFVPYYILAFVIIFIGVFVFLAFFKPASTQPSTDDYDASLQFSEPAETEEVAVMKTNMGDIAMRFFENEAPKAVENFKTLAKDNYYDGITFHRVINDFMIQAGDPTGTGAGGKSSFGEKFEDEFSPNLLNVRGSISMANSGPNTNSSQFFINQTKTVDESLLDGDVYPEEAKQLYKDNGGNPTLDGYYSLGETDKSGHTVFAQVLNGMDVVDSIAAVETSGDKPVKDVIIESISFMSYSDYLASNTANTSSDAAADASSVDSAK